MLHVLESQSHSDRHDHRYQFSHRSTSFRKIASCRDQYEDTDVGYSQLLPSTKYWSPGKLPDYLEKGTDYEKRYQKSDYDFDVSLTTTYDMDHSDNLRTSPIRRHSSRSTSAPMRRTRILTSKRTADQQEEEKLTTQSNNLTNSSDVDAWKLWLEEKQKRLQEEKEKKRMEEEQQLESEKTKEIEKMRRLQISKLKRQEWLAKKLKDEIEAKMKEERKLTRKETKKMKEEEEKKAKNDERVKEWKEKKAAKEKEHKEKKKEEELNEKKESEEKERKAREKYEQWVKEANSRPSRVSASLGYTGGRLIGYYDWNSYPSPSYYNPVPWQPIEVPEKAKPKVKSASSNKQTSSNNRTKKPAVRPASAGKVITSNKSNEPKKSQPKEILSPPLMWKEVLARKK